MVSIIIPVYNGRKYLGAAIESALHQTCRETEVLVIDDGSTDNSAEIAASYPGVRLFRQPHLGVSAARNHGIRRSKGEYISFLDADDLLLPDKIEKQLFYLDAHPEINRCYTEIENFTDLCEAELTPRQKQVMNTHVDNILPSMCARRSVFEQAGVFDVSLQYGEDTEWNSRLELLGETGLATLEECLYRRRIHSFNLTSGHEYHGWDTLKPVMVKAKMHAQIMKQHFRISVVLTDCREKEAAEVSVTSVFWQNWLGRMETVEVAGGSGRIGDFNEGIGKADGDYLVFLKAGDSFTANAAELFMQALFDPVRPELIIGKAAFALFPECALIHRTVFESVGLFDPYETDPGMTNWLDRVRKAGIRIKTIEAAVVRGKND